MLVKTFQAKFYVVIFMTYFAITNNVNSFTFNLKETLQTRAVNFFAKASKKPTPEWKYQAPMSIISYYDTLLIPT